VNVTIRIQAGREVAAGEERGRGAENDASVQTQCNSPQMIFGCGRRSHAALPSSATPATCMARSTVSW